MNLNPSKSTELKPPEDWDQLKSEISSKLNDVFYSNQCGDCSEYLSAEEDSEEIIELFNEHLLSHEQKIREEERNSLDGAIKEEREGVMYRLHKVLFPGE